MTNYTSIRTCAAIGSNLAASLPSDNDGAVSIPLMSRETRELHVSKGADWNQRLAFEWGLLAGCHRRCGDESTAAYCDARVVALAGDMGY